MTTEKKQDTTRLLVLILLILNILLGVYIAFFKHDALWLETLKAGGRENMEMATKLYESPVYIQQQKTTLDQILGSMNQAPTQQPAVQPVAQPAVTQ